MHIKIKRMMKKLINNAVHNLWTSIAGSVAGIAEIKQGVTTGNTTHKPDINRRQNTNSTQHRQNININTT